MMRPVSKKLFHQDTNILLEVSMCESDTGAIYLEASSSHGKDLLPQLICFFFGFLQFY